MSVITSKPPFVIFLDIDGVLLSDWDVKKAEKNLTPECRDYLKKHEEFIDRDSNRCSDVYWSIRNAHYFSKSAVANLDDLIRRVEANFTPCVVISSEWRKDRSVEELKTIYFGMHSFAKYIIDKTADRLSPGGKRWEIQSWLEHHPEVKHFCVVDDENEGLRDKFGKRFIRTSPLNLLSKEEVKETESILELVEGNV